MVKYSASDFEALRHKVRSSRSAFSAPVIAVSFIAMLAAGCAGRQASAPDEPAAVPVAAEPDDIQPIADNSEAAAGAGDLSLRDDAPLRYTVKKGDTLWDIAEYFLRDAWQWPELWYTNSQVRNPHLIYPGDVLTLVSIDGKTRLTRDLASNRLSPRIREEAIDAALPAIPIEAIRNFLRGPRLVTLDEAKRAPYIVEFVDERLAVGANNDIYVKNLPADTDYSYAVVRIGDAYRDPDTRDLLGYEALPTGEAELRAPAQAVGQPATMRLTKSSREVLIADRLLPIEAESFDANFYPHPPANAVDGRILSVYDGLSQISQYQIVAMNRGSDDGLDPGTVLDIFQAGRSVPDPYGKRAVQLPDQYAGVLMVFKVTPRLCYGLVINAARPIHVLDKVKKPAPTLR